MVVDDSAGGTDEDDSSDEEFLAPAPPPQEASTSTATPHLRTSDGIMQLPAGVNANAADLLGRRLCAGTKKNYKAALAKYAKWCAENNLDPECASMDAFAVQTTNFLADTFKKNKVGYGTIKTYLAAISTSAFTRLRGRVGEEQIVKTLMEAIHRASPDTPKYEAVPSIGPIFQLLEEWPDNDELDIRQLLGKVGTLLMLFGLRKADQLHITVAKSELEPDEEGVIFLSCLTKTSKTAFVRVPIPPCPEHPKWCAVRALQTFWAKRPKKPKDADALLLTAKGTIASPAWLRNCVRMLMDAAGYDAELGPHVLRHMGCTRAVEMHVHGDLIARQYHWQRGQSNTLAFTYLHPGDASARELANAIYRIDLPAARGPEEPPARPAPPQPSHPRRKPRRKGHE